MPKKTIIHVNQHVIRANRKNGTDDPTLTVKSGKKNTYAHEVEILGPSRVVYRPDKPLSCGARVWIETTGPVSLTTRKKRKNGQEGSDGEACRAR